MVDWNKDVKLSDLLGRKQKDATEPVAAGLERASDDVVQPAAEALPTPAPTPAAPVAVSPAPPAPPAPAQVISSAPSVSEPAVVDSAPHSEPAESVPWFKRELSLGRNSKKSEPKAEKPAKQPKEKKQKEKKPKGEKVPLHKRELSLSFGRSAKGPGAGSKTQKGKSQKTSQSPKRLKNVTGLKIGGSQLAAARVQNNGVPELMQVARQGLEDRKSVV